MRDAIACEALTHWGISEYRLELVAHRENTVYRVIGPAVSYALRLHRPGYRSRAELDSELDWMAALSAKGLVLPAPVPAISGQYCVEVRGLAVDLLNWLDGASLGRNGKIQPQPSERLASSFKSLGQTMAQLHTVSDQWIPPNNFQRPAWDIEGLLGDQPLWGRFWENPGLSTAQVQLLQDARGKARDCLEKHESALDYGLIHADLVPDNVLMHPKGVALIDFDDSGYGFRLFELATVINRVEPQDAGGTWVPQLIDAYITKRPQDLRWLPLFKMVRALTYVGWVVPRLQEPGSAERNERFVSLACVMAGEFVRGGSKMPVVRKKRVSPPTTGSP